MRRLTLETVAQSSSDRPIPGDAALAIQGQVSKGSPIEPARSASSSMNRDLTATSSWATPSTRFYLPSVSIADYDPNIKTKRSVHILGNDERSKFLAYALRSAFDSVQLVGQDRRYRNVTTNLPGQGGSAATTPNTGLSRRAIETHRDKDDPISNLIVTGSPSDCVPAMESIRHRIDDNTAVCLMQDGLGIVEEVDSKVFSHVSNQADAGVSDAKKPSYLLGHMTQSLVYDRNAKSVRERRPGRTALTVIEPIPDQPEDLAYGADLVRQPQTASFLRALASSSHLNAGGFPFDKWLKLKLPALIFASVVEPICVMLDCHYGQIAQNSWAPRLIDQLLGEIGDVVDAFPEVQHSPEVRALLRGEGIRKDTYARLRAKGSAPSKMRMQIQRGQLTDIAYLNGYFIQRGLKLGIKLPANEMVVGMVKAKHAAQMRRLKEGYIPWDAPDSYQ